MLEVFGFLVLALLFFLNYLSCFGIAGAVLFVLLFFRFLVVVGVAVGFWIH